MPTPPPGLPENRGLAFRGTQPRGRFEVGGAAARRFLAAANRHGKSNREVVRQWAGAPDLRHTARQRWIIDFPPGTDEREAGLFELPFARIRRTVRPVWRRRRGAWWIHGDPRFAMRVALAKRERFIATPAAGRLRVFAWLEPEVLPDQSLIVFARDDDFFFGVLHSRIHDAWARWTAALPHATRAGFRYRPSACFETFPFPWPPATPLGKLTRAQEERRTAVAQAARALDAQRNEWLGDRRDKKRTLTALYRTRPAWLASAHAVLDDAVAAAYDWPADLPENEVTSRLLALNQARAAGS